MKINKIYISAFGGLKDFTLELGDGLNVIYGNNEDGKSTVTAFIKAMFFGTGKKTQNLSNSIRQKYAPWDGSVMAGRIFFEHSGKNYCLEREFRKSDSTDRILLTNTDSGKQLDTTENIGSQFFNMSAAAFERSLFIGAGGDFAPDSTASGEINAKLSNIAVTGSEDTSYQKVAKNILDAKNRVISKSGRVGSYVEDARLLDELKVRLNNAENDAKKIAELNAEILSFQNEYEPIYKKYTELKVIVDCENDLKNREKLLEYLETKSQLDEQTKALTLKSGTVVDKAYIDKVNFLLKRYDTTSDRISALKSDIEQIENSIKLQIESTPEDTKNKLDTLTVKVGKLSTQKDGLIKNEADLQNELTGLENELCEAQNKKSAVNSPLLIIAILLLISTVVCIKLSFIPAVVTGALSAVMFILAFALRPKNKSLIARLQNTHDKISDKLNSLRTEKNLLQEEINNTTAEINMLSSVLNAGSVVIEQRKADLEKKKSALNEQSEKLESELCEIKALISDFIEADTAEHIKNALISVTEKTEAQKQLKLRLSYLSRDLGNISYEAAREKLRQIESSAPDNSADIEAAKADYDAARERLSEIKTKITENATELKTAFRNSENPEDIKREIAECKNRLTSKKEFCDTAELALEILEESFYEVRKGYGSELEKKTVSIFKNLTDGKYNRITVSDNLEMSVEQADSFGTHELDFLSLGTTHQAYLSLRLAIASLISKDESLPIFLDDSLSQYDDKRLAQAISFLNEYCKNGQGVLFTCHNAICDIAAAKNIAVQKPYK